MPSRNAFEQAFDLGQRYERTVQSAVEHSHRERSRLASRYVSKCVE
jgi:hypothetical protein